VINQVEIFYTYLVWFLFNLFLTLKDKEEKQELVFRYNVSFFIVSIIIAFKLFLIGK